MIYNNKAIFFNIHSILNNPISKKYYTIFKALDKIIKKSPIIYQKALTGRKPYSRVPFLRAFIIKTLENFKFTSQLTSFLKNNPIISFLCGFDDPYNLPDDSQFYRFLKNTPNNIINHICHNAINILHSYNLLDTSTVSVDSKPIIAYTKHNNFKNPNRIINNSKKPFKHNSRNFEATLSFYSAGANSNNNNNKSNAILFWGYRIHVVSDKNGIPIAFVIHKNNVKDHIAFQDLLPQLISHNFNIFFVLADKAYDNNSFYNSIATYLNAIALVPLRKNTNQKNYYSLTCQAGLTMKFNGRVKEKNRTRLKFRCPILIANKKQAKNLPSSCPWNHPKFISGKKYGCVKYIDVKAQNRLSIDRDSNLFKHIYKKRKAVERTFSNSHFLGIETPTHFSFNAIKNFASINILSQLLVAIVAGCVLKNKSKMRCYKSFASNIKNTQQLKFNFAA